MSGSVSPIRPGATQNTALMRTASVGVSSQVFTDTVDSVEDRPQVWGAERLAVVADSPAPLLAIHTPSTEGTKWRGLWIFETCRPVSLTHERPAMTKKTNHTVVFVNEVQEIPGTYLAMFGAAGSMNVALGRASEYIESKRLNVTQKTLRNDSPINGHDLRGIDLLRFWEAYAPVRGPLPTRTKVGEPTNATDIASLLETDFWEQWLLPKLAINPSLVLIAGFTSDVPGELRCVLSHELLHAQFFKNHDYQRLALLFWNDSITPRDRRKILKELGTGDCYDTRDAFQMANEFQAYVLQRSARHGGGAVLARFVDRYRDALVNALTQGGQPPMRFEIGTKASYSFRDGARMIRYTITDSLAKYVTPRQPNHKAKERPSRSNFQTAPTQQPRRPSGEALHHAMALTDFAPNASHACRVRTAEHPPQGNSHGTRP